MKAVILAGGVGSRLSEETGARRYMTYHRMGDGSSYVFYTSYHLCNFEAPITAANFRRVTILQASRRDSASSAVCSGTGPCRYADLEIPAGPLVDALRAQQDRLFGAVLRPEGGASAAAPYISRRAAAVRRRDSR